MPDENKGNEGFELMSRLPTLGSSTHMYGTFSPGDEPPASWHCDVSMVSEALVVTVPGIDITVLRAWAANLNHYADVLAGKQNDDKTTKATEPCVHDKTRWYINPQHPELGAFVEVCRECGLGRFLYSPSSGPLWVRVEAEDRSWGEIDVEEFQLADPPMGKRWRRDANGQLFHDGDCEFFSTGICTCGLIHWVMPRDYHEGLEEQIAQHESQLSDRAYLNRLVTALVRQWDRQFPDDRSTSLAQTVNELAATLKLQRTVLNQSVYEVKATCENGHSSTICIRGRMAPEAVKLWTGLMDGTSSFYISKPGPESAIGKCGVCGAPFTTEIRELNRVEEEPNA